MADNSDRPERPRAEPEILPPDRGGRPDDGRFGGRGPNWPPPPFGYTARGTHRVFVGRIGPLGFALLLLAIGLLGALMLFILIGAALIWIPVVAVLLVAAAIGGLFRRL
jgi:hypothetical protein